LGYGWSHDFEYRLEQPDEHTVIIHGPGGTQRRFSFCVIGDLGSLCGEPGDFGSLRAETGGGFRLTEKDQLTRLFDGAGRLTSVFEPNGNAITLTDAGGTTLYECDVENRLVR
jgi:hypothetical protein